MGTIPGPRQLAFPDLSISGAAAFALDAAALVLVYGLSLAVSALHPLWRGEPDRPGRHGWRGESGSSPVAEFLGPRRTYRLVAGYPPAPPAA